MEVIKIIGLISSFILMAISVIMIFDARKIVNKLFSFSDQNNGAKWMKIGGLFIFIIGALILYFSLI